MTASAFRDVTRRRKTDRIAIASPRDFSLGQPRELQSGAVALPYCLDIPRRRALYVLGASTDEARAAPFYYLHLRQAARAVGSFAWGSLPIRSDRAKQRPVFVFSPGRAGSTLLSRALSAAGAASVSEPDFYTQATMAFWASPANPLGASLRKAVQSLTRDLVTALGDEAGLVIKLRSECCRAPGMILGAEARTIFVVRGFEDWARSTIGVFRTSPRTTVSRYLRALRCYGWLRQHVRCSALRYELLASGDERAISLLTEMLGRAIDGVRFLHALREPSQAETPLDPTIRPARENAKDVLATTLALWNSNTVRGACKAIPFSEEVL